MGAAWRGRDPSVVFPLGLCMWFLGVAGVRAQCLGLLGRGWGVDWTYRCHVLHYLRGFGAGFLGVLCMTGWDSWAGQRGLCVVVMVQAVHRLWGFGIA